MSLSEEYERQYAFRNWQKIFERLPNLSGSVVLDLGCSIGDQAAELAARGARVIGIDSNEELLAVARARAIPNAQFLAGDLAAPLAVQNRVDGIWASFSLAYFPDLTSRLKSWKKHLEPGGWIALTEVDDLFGHEPLEPETRALLSAYARDAAAAGRYDFYMGHRLREHVASAGFGAPLAFTVEDQEFSFEGAAAAHVLAGWVARFERMASLRRFCGARFDQVRAGFLAALAKPEHRATSTVHCCIARGA